MRGLSFENTRPPEAEGDQPANLPQVAPNMSFLTPDLKSKLGRELQNRIGVMSGGGNAQQQMSARLAAEQHDSDEGTKMLARRLFRQGKVEEANRVIAVGSGKTYEPYRINGDGVVINQGTGIADASNPFAQSNIKRVDAKTALDSASAETEWYEREKVKTEIELAKIRGDGERVKQLMESSKDLYTTTTTDQFGNKIVNYDANAWAQDIAGAFASGKPAGLVAADRIIKGNEAFANVGGFVEKLANAGNPQFVDRRNDPQPASVGTMLDSGSKAAALIQSGQVRTPDDVRRLLQTGQIDALGARYIADYMSGKK